jgi:hypothetical protein
MTSAHAAVIWATLGLVGLLIYYQRCLRGFYPGEREEWRRLWAIATPIQRVAFVVVHALGVVLAAGLGPIRLSIELAYKRPE